jgi:uncharacterized protein
MAIVSHREWDFQEPMLLVGFPSRGLVGAIVASYLVPHLKMELVATMDSPNFPPVASVRDGKALSPVQFYASRQQCGPDGRCSQLVVIRSDAAPDPWYTDEIADEILDYAERIGCKLIVTLEGSDHVAEGSVFAVTNLVSDVDVRKLGAEPFTEGSLTGVSAPLLTHGNGRGIAGVCLFTGVRDEVPDAQAAARLVQVADLLVPGIVIDTDRLVEQAKRFEKKLRAAIAEQHKAGERPEERYIM